MGLVYERYSGEYDRRYERNFAHDCREGWNDQHAKVDMNPVRAATGTTCPPELDPNAREYFRDGHLMGKADGLAHISRVYRRYQAGYNSRFEDASAAATGRDGRHSGSDRISRIRSVSGGMLVGAKMASQRVMVRCLDGGFTFKYQGVMSSSPRLAVEGVARTPECQQYIYSNDDRVFSVADGGRYFELAKCK